MGTSRHGARGHTAPVSVPSCDVPDVVAGLDAVRVAIIHAGQVGTFEIFHLACKGARRTRSALAAALDVGIKFPTVFTEPARREGGNPFTMLSAIADASFLSTLAGRPARRSGEAPRGPCRGRDGGAAGVPHLSRCGPPRRPRGRGQGKGKGQGQGRRQRQRQGPRQGGRRP